VITVKIGPSEPRSLRIVGRSVIPPVANDLAGGVGAWMTFEALRSFDAGVAEDLYLFRFAEGVDPDVGLQHLKSLFPDLSVTVGAFGGETANLARVRSLPILLAGLLALIAVATLIHTLTTVVRRRGRDLAILKTLGFERSQIRATIAWQATTLVLITIVVGIPLGIASGRWSWTVFASQLGVVPEPIVRQAAALLSIPAALVLGNAIAAVSGRTAARSRPAVVLRSE
jgi:putative ABC transport system permease protein